MTPKHFLLIFLSGLIVQGCSNKFLIKPGDSLEIAFNKASLLYEKKRYAEAASAFETVLSMGRGTATAEKAQFLLAESYFKNGETLLAAAEYERFSNTYPKAERASEASFLEAYCFFELSPRYKLDQQDSEKALDKFQLYLSRYPESQHADSVVHMMDAIRNKLGRKYYESGRLYMKLRQYKAAAIYFGLAMDRYPESAFAEPALSEQIHAYLLYAVNSVEDKQVERLNNAVASYEKYVQIFPDGKNRGKVEKWFDEARLEINRLKKEKEKSSTKSIFSD